ncbi:MAG TPA: hypothetical protein VGF96_18685 [Terracidiphilus sp.]|jgi:hypothetical protein
MLLAFKRLFLVPDPPFDDDPRGPRAALPPKIERLTVVSGRKAVLLPVNRQGHTQAPAPIFSAAQQKETNLRPFPTRRIRPACTGCAAAA